MTLEEMIDLVAEHVPMRGNGEDLAAPIIAALRAGQAMREATSVDKWLKGAVAWDIAVRGDDNDD